MTKLTLDDYQNNPITAHQEFIKNMPLQHLKVITKRNHSDINSMTKLVNHINNDFINTNYHKFCKQKYLDKNDSSKKAYHHCEHKLIDKIEHFDFRLLILKQWYHDDILAIKQAQ